ncbi:MAG: energy-coupling factor ABC transporter ATP-binding protein [Synergistaceae bacterium]|nr:energy-coupling factor ABC transporter ATP-binding protein [Synergistaceae bacterium]MBQ6664356.1 energy-coupling factor ABC transporter ATP-binding protein [Synergistaceae bacterium]MBQ6981454.1 energy-coupling factor ABC transporter ATP-binding protein [Synergistaceae bacterium]MBR0248155.1 energy-coupling factor ABC transporter ATP-binding protein [Synergistaceae bacterium]
MLEVEGLRYQYPDGHEALRGVSLSVGAGEKVAIVGANGSGKSTLLLHIAGAVEVQSGRITLNGRDGSDILREKVGLTFQNADDELLMPSVIEDVAFSLVASGMPPHSAHERAGEILTKLGISHLSSRPPHRLSGGEKRLVTFAGILASNPEILALDEPTAGLDPKARRRVINFLRETEKAVILATHDLDMAIDVCNRAVILSGGVISAEGELPELFKNGKILEASGLELPLRFQS